MRRAPARPADGSALLVGPPSGRSRRAIGAFIAAVILYQIATPLSYYLGDEPFEERFAWRMFSPLQVRPCEFSVFERVGPDAADRRPISFESIVEAWWIEGLERNRPRIVRAVLNHACDLREAESVHYEHRCAALDGTPQPPSNLVLDCGSHAERPEGAA